MNDDDEDNFNNNKSTWCFTTFTLKVHTRPLIFICHVREYANSAEGSTTLVI